MRSRPKSCSAARVLWERQRSARLSILGGPHRACGCWWWNSSPACSRQRWPRASTYAQRASSRCQTLRRTSAGMYRPEFADFGVARRGRVADGAECRAFVAGCTARGRAGVGAGCAQRIGVTGEPFGLAVQRIVRQLCEGVHTRQSTPPKSELLVAPPKPVFRVGCARKAKALARRV